MTSLIRPAAEVPQLEWDSSYSEAESQDEQSAFPRFEDFDDYMDVVHVEEFDPCDIEAPSLEYGDRLFRDFISMDELMANALGERDISDRNLVKTFQIPKASRRPHATGQNTLIRAASKDVCDMNEATLRAESAESESDNGSARRRNEMLAAHQQGSALESEQARGGSVAPTPSTAWPTAPFLTPEAAHIQEAMAAVGGNVVRLGPKVPFICCHQCGFINNWELTRRCIECQHDLCKHCTDPELSKRQVTRWTGPRTDDAPLARTS